MKRTSRGSTASDGRPRVKLRSPSPGRNEALNDVLQLREKGMTGLGLYYVCDLLQVTEKRKSNERKEGVLLTSRDRAG